MTSYGDDDEESWFDVRKALYPEFEAQLVIRFPPDIADTVRAFVEKGQHRMSIEWLGGEDDEVVNRNAHVIVNDVRYAAVLTDLPTVVESYKRMTPSKYYKSADIGQVLLVLHEVGKESTVSGEWKPLWNYDKDSFLLNSGITPPMRDIQSRVFEKRGRRKRANFANIERNMVRVINDGFEAIEDDGKCELITPEALAGLTLKHLKLHDEGIRDPKCTKVIFICDGEVARLPGEVLLEKTEQELIRKAKEREQKRLARKAEKQRKRLEAAAAAAAERERKLKLQQLLLQQQQQLQQPPPPLQQQPQQPPQQPQQVSIGTFGASPIPQQSQPQPQPQPQQSQPPPPQQTPPTLPRQHQPQQGVTPSLIPSGSAVPGAVPATAPTLASSSAMDTTPDEGGPVPQQQVPQQTPQGLSQARRLELQAKQTQLETTLGSQAEKLAALESSLARANPIVRPRLMAQKKLLQTEMEANRAQLSEVEESLKQ